MNIIKVGFKMLDGSKFIGKLMHKEHNSIDAIVHSRNNGAPVPVHGVTVSGKVIPTVYINRDHVSLWWEV